MEIDMNQGDILKKTKNQIKIAKEKLKYYYLFDNRPFCVAYSGGKDSSVVVDLVIQMLLELRDKHNIFLTKEIYIINSNTLAELPPVLKYVQNTLKSIDSFVKTQKLPIKVKEVTPELKHTLNVQLFGVGMPPPSSSFRWCTTKLKVSPIEKFLKEIFPDGRFISIIGSRKEESYERAIRLSNISQETEINLLMAYIKVDMKIQSIIKILEIGFGKRHKEDGS